MGYRFVLWRDKLLLLTLAAFFYEHSSPMRVAARAALEGSDFSWAYYSGVTLAGKAAVAQGKGLYGHADYILFAGFTVLWLLWTGLRKPDAYFRAALAGWTTISFGIGLWLSLSLGDSLAVSKETLGLHGLSFFWTEVLPGAIPWLLAIALLVRGLRRETAVEPSPWTRLNNIFAAAALAFLLLAAVLLNIGPAHGWADFAGIGMLYVSFFLLLGALSPWERKAGSPEMEQCRADTALTA